MANVELRGLEQAVGHLAQRAAVGLAVERTAYAVVNDKVYARPIVTGRFRDGRIARRAGGTWSITRAAAAVGPLLAPAIARAIPQGPAAVLRALRTQAGNLLEQTKTREAVRSGALRAAWRIVARNARGWGPL